MCLNKLVLLQLRKLHISHIYWHQHKLRPHPDHLDDDQGEAHLHDTNCGNIFLARDNFPKHMESLHVVLVLPVSFVVTPRRAAA